MTPLQLSVLDLVRERIAVAGFSPTIGELSTELGAAMSAIHRAVDNLVDGGYLARRAWANRGLSVVDVPDMRSVPTDILRAELARRGVSLEALNRKPPRAIGHEVTCAADTCGTVVRRGHLMCLTHWCLLPHELRNRILRANAARDQEAFGLAVTEARDLIDNTDWRERA